MPALWPKGPRQWVWFVVAEVALLPSPLDPAQGFRCPRFISTVILYFTTTERALVICSGWLVARADVTRGPFQHGQRFFLLCRYEKAQGVNLGLEFFVSTIKAMATISDLHEIYAFQSSFARLESKFVAFCCERDRVTCNKAPLSRRRKMRRISTQRSVNVSDQFFGVTPTSSASA